MKRNITSILNVKLKYYNSLRRIFAVSIPIEPENFRQDHQSDLFQKELDREPSREDNNPIEYMKEVVEYNYLTPDQFVEIVNELGLNLDILSYPITNNRIKNPIEGILYIVTNTTDMFISEDCYGMEEAETWINNINDIDRYVAWEKNIYENIEQIYYHGTSEEYLDSIMKNGLNPKNMSRGFTNRGTGNAIFLTPRPEYGNNYGNIVFEVNIGKWMEDYLKHNKSFPVITLEEPVEECEKYNLLAYKIGLKDYHKYCDSSDGIEEDTLIVYENIPPKYLKILD